MARYRALAIEPMESIARLCVAVAVASTSEQSRIIVEVKAQRTTTCTCKAMPARASHSWIRSLATLLEPSGARLLPARRTSAATEACCSPAWDECRMCRRGERSSDWVNEMTPQGLRDPVRRAHEPHQLTNRRRRRIAEVVRYLDLRLSGPIFRAGPGANDPKHGRGILFQRRPGDRRQSHPRLVRVVPRRSPPGPCTPSCLPVVAGNPAARLAAVPAAGAWLSGIKRGGAQRLERFRRATRM